MPFVPDSTALDPINEKKLSYTDMNEYNDNQKFPPIKQEKDPFVNWFWLLSEKYKSMQD